MWIKLYTKIFNWEWYSDINTTRLFIHCLLKANWKDGKFEGRDILRGSFVTSRGKLAKETGLSIQQTRTSLNKLKSTNDVTIVPTNKFSIITMKNYEIYQESNQDSNFPSTINQPTNNHNLRITEYKNIDTYSYLEKIWGRPITSSEIEMIDVWLKTFDGDIIKLAIDKTVLNEAKNLRYTEAIINSWHDKGYKTLDECKNEGQAVSKNISEEKQMELDELAEWDWLNED